MSAPIAKYSRSVSLIDNADSQEALTDSNQKQLFNWSDEVSLLVFRFLPFTDLLNTSLTCRKWKSLSIEAGKNYCRDVTAHLFKMLQAPIPVSGKLVAKESLKDLLLQTSALQKEALPFLIKLKKKTFKRLYQALQKNSLPRCKVLDLAFWLRKREVVNQEINGSPKWIHLKLIAEGLAKIGEFEDALNTANFISDEKYQINVECAMIRLAIKSQGTKAALEMARIISNDIGKASAFAVVAKALVKTNLTEALKVANEALEFTKTQAANQSPNKCQTLENISDVLLTISEQLAKNNKPSEALIIIDNVRAIVDLIVEKTSLTRILLGTSKVLTQLKNEDALLFANKALEAAHTILADPFLTKSQILLSISEQLAILGDFQKAIETARLIPFFVYKGQAILSISRTYAESNNLDAAVTLAQEGKRLSEQKLPLSQKDTLLFSISRTFLYISEKFHENNNVDRAREMVENAKASAYDIANRGLQTKTLENISKKNFERDI